MQPTASIRSRTVGGVVALLVAFLPAAVVSACRPGPPPSIPQSEVSLASPSPDSEPTPSRAPETFTLDEAAALYEEIRDEMENPDRDLVARLGLDPSEIEENTSEFEKGLPHREIPGLEDSFQSFEQGDFLSAHDRLEIAFKTFIMGECFSPLTSECIVLPEEEVVAVDPQFQYLPDPGKPVLRFSVLRKEAAFRIVTLLRVLAARAEGMEVQPLPTGTLTPVPTPTPTPRSSIPLP